MLLEHQTAHRTRQQQGPKRSWEESRVGQTLLIQAVAKRQYRRARVQFVLTTDKQYKDAVSNFGRPVSDV